MFAEHVHSSSGLTFIGFSRPVFLRGKMFFCQQTFFSQADLFFNKSLNVFVVASHAFIGFSRPKELFSWAAFPIGLKVKSQLWSLFKLDIHPKISSIFVCISGPDKREENGKGIFGRNGRLMEDGWLGIDYIQNNMLLHKKYRTGQKL